MSSNAWKLLIFNLLVVFFFTGCGSTESEDVTTSTPSTKTQKTLFAVYMMGSNLETDGLAGSKDLLEILTGYYSLTPDQQKNVNIRVAFGGSNSSTWHGVRYADAECLLDDLNTDSIFGNASCYTYEDTSANMSASSTLTDFINSLSLSTSSYDKTIFTFWNHGGSYDGVCYDDTGSDKLTLAELKTSLNATSANFDIIGMDACLMGSLEVAKTLSSYGSYLVASEELEPGHGWNYEELIVWLGVNPSATLTNISKVFVDSYIDTTAHQGTKDKTLSVIDLKKVDSFLSNFNDILYSLDSKNDFSFILDSARDAQQYALNSRYSIPTGRSMDLKNFLQNLKLRRTDLATKIDTLDGLIDDFIVYNRYQDTKRDSNGISIFQPLNVGQWNGIYKNEADFISTDWYNLVGGFLTEGLNDTEDPVKSTENSCQRSSVDGYCMDVTDNIGVSDAENYTLVPYGDDYLLLGTDKLSKTNTSEYFLPKQDDSWLYFCDGVNSPTTACIIPSAIFIGEYDNNYVYSTYANVNDKYSEFYIVVNMSDGSLDYWSVEINDSGVASKNQKNIVKGDKLQFYYYIVSMSGSDSWIVGDELTFMKEPTTSVEKLGATVSYFASFADFKGNSITSNIYTSD